MRASRFLRQRAQMNRTRYAMRALVSEVLPSLVDSMQTMNDTLRIQGRIAAREHVMAVLDKFEKYRQEHPAEPDEDNWEYAYSDESNHEPISNVVAKPLADLPGHTTLRRRAAGRWEPVTERGGSDV